MAIENVSDIALVLPAELVGQISFLTSTLQALGGIILIYLIFGIINVILSRKRSKKIDEILKEMKKLNKNLKKS